MKRHKGTGEQVPRDPITPEIVERCKQGDQDAWAQLVEATHRDVYTLCLRILRDPDDAAEATQDTYFKVWRSLHGFRGDAMFSTWLYRVASNTAISKHRKRGRVRRHESSGDEEQMTRIPSRASTESAAGARVEMVELEAALESLPAHSREAVVLRDVYGLSIDEIAKQQGISETAAKVRVHRGRKKLKQLMWPEEQAEE